MLYGRTVRSTIACVIESIAIDAPGCVGRAERDIPGENVVVGHDREQPCLVEREIRHVAEPLLSSPMPAAMATARREGRGGARPKTPLLDPRL
jgi:hypothetical protein